MKNTLAPVVLVTAVALQKIRAWTAIAKGEFSALGTVEVIGGQLLITDVFLVEQTAGSGSTEMDDEGVARLLIALEEAGEDSSQLRCWVHSHGDMDTFWSATDEQCIRGLNNGAWVLSWVTNKVDADRLRLDVFEPVRVTVDHLDLQVDVDDLGLAAWCAEQFAEKVDERPTFVRHGRRTARPDVWTARTGLTDPPWPHDPDDEDDGHLLGDLDDDGWDDGWDRDWEVHDGNPLALQLDDPWNACLALEAYR
jgi:hypothetical protein